MFNKKESKGYSVSEMNKHCSGGVFGKLYLFWGNEEYLKDFYINKIKDGVLKGDTVNYIAFDGKITPEQLFEACNTIPMFADRIFVLVRNSGIFKGDAQEKSFDFLDALPAEVCLVFRENEADVRKSLFKTVEQNGILFECCAQSDETIGQILAKYLNSKGCTVTKDAVSLLIAGLGKDLTDLISECEKLSLYVGPGGTVTEATVREVSSLSAEASVFDLLDSLADGDKQRAYVFCNKLLVDDREEPGKLFALISGNYIKLYNVKQLMDEGNTKEKIAEKTGYRDFAVRKLMGQCRRYTAGHIREKMQMCSSLDIDVKSGKLSVENALEVIMGS